MFLMRKYVKLIIIIIIYRVPQNVSQEVNASELRSIQRHDLLGFPGFYWALLGLTGHFVAFAHEKAGEFVPDLCPFLGLMIH